MNTMLMTFACSRSISLAASIPIYFGPYTAFLQPRSTFPQFKIFRWMAYNLCNTKYVKLGYRISSGAERKRAGHGAGAQEGMIQFGQITSNLPNEYYTHKRIIVFRSGWLFASLARLRSAGSRRARAMSVRVHSLFYRYAVCVYKVMPDASWPCQPCRCAAR